MKRPIHRYSVTTFDPKAAWWCGHFRDWFGREVFNGWGYRASTHRGFRTLKQARAHAAALVLCDIMNVCVVENRSGRDWLLSSTTPGDGADAASAIAWARAYLATPRRKR